MKTLKIIGGILLLVGGFGSLYSFFINLEDYEATDTLGHLIAIAVLFGLAYLLLKPSKK